MLSTGRMGTRTQVYGQELIRSRIPPILNWRHKSLARGTFVAALGLILALVLSRFTGPRGNMWLTGPAILALLGPVDTARCLRKQWGFYHAGVLLFLCAETMSLALVLFVLITPFLF